MNRFAMVLSMIAVLLSGLAAIGSWRSTRHDPRPEGPDLTSQLEGLQQRVTLLGRQMEALKIGLAVRAVSPAAGSDPASANGQGDLQANLVALSQRLGELEQQTETARRLGMLAGPLGPGRSAWPDPAPDSGGPGRP